MTKIPEVCLENVFPGVQQRRSHLNSLSLLTVALNDGHADGSELGTSCTFPLVRLSLSRS